MIGLDDLGLKPEVLALVEKRIADAYLSGWTEGRRWLRVQWSAVPSSDLSE